MKNSTILTRINLLKYLSVFFLIISVSFLNIGGCGNEDSGNGGGNTTTVVNTLCGSINQSQDSNFIDCNMSISVINESGSTQTQQEGGANPVRTALINIPLLEDIENRNFVNAAIDFNGDGVIADYDTANGQQKEWFVINNPVIVLPIGYNFYFQIVDSTVVTGIPYNLKIILGDVAVMSADEFNGEIPQGVSFIEGSIELSIFNFENMVDPDPDAFGSGEFNSGNGLTSSDSTTSRGTQIMTVDGVEIVVLDGVPDLPQSINTCVPNSIANSIAWLADTFNFDLMIDDGGGTVLPVDLNDLESIANDLLNPFINHIGDNNGFLMQNGQVKGMLGENIVPLKNSFLEMNNIPVKTTQINIDPENPGDLIEQLKDRLEEGCIAELLLQFFNAQGQKIGGHVVNMTGYSLGPAFNEDEFGDIIPGDTSGLKKIVFHDANHTVFDNDTGEVIPQNDIYDFDITSDEILIENYMYGSTGTTTVKLVGAIVQCVDVESEETNFSFTAVPDGELSIIHKISQSPCPQRIGTITVTNDGDVPFDWFRLGLAGTRTTPSAGSLAPGESVTLTVDFTCDLPADIMGDIRIKAVVGQTEQEISIPVSVDVQ